MSKSEQDKNPISKRTKKKKTKKDKKKQKKKDKSKISNSLNSKISNVININIGKSGGGTKAKKSNTARGFTAPTSSLRGQRGRGNLTYKSMQGEMNANVMQNVFGIRSTAMQQGQDLRDLTGNFNNLRQRVEGLGTQTLNSQNQQLTRDETQRRFVEEQLRENAQRQQEDLANIHQLFTQEVADTRQALTEGQQELREALAQDALDTRWAMTQGYNTIADDILGLQGGLAEAQRQQEEQQRQQEEQQQ